jgi:hypothetical protein
LVLSACFDPFLSSFLPAGYTRSCLFSHSLLSFLFLSTPHLPISQFRIPLTFFSISSIRLFLLHFCSLFLHLRLFVFLSNSVCFYPSSIHCHSRLHLLYHPSHPFAITFSLSFPISRSLFLSVFLSLSSFPSHCPFCILLPFVTLFLSNSSAALLLRNSPSTDIKS